MRVLKTSNEKINKIIKEAVKIILAGGIVIHPTDSCYGIAADITNRSAIEKVYNFKKRKKNHPINIIAANKEELKKYGRWSPVIGGLLKNKKKMYSFVVEKTDCVPTYLNREFNDIGIQIPRHKLSLLMLEKISRPLSATSANISGRENVYSVPHLLNQIKDAGCEPDLIIDSGILIRRKSSTVVRIIDDSCYSVLRR